MPRIPLDGCRGVEDAFLSWQAQSSRRPERSSGHAKIYELRHDVNGPDWIAKAERVTKSFRAATARDPGAHHFVYVVLLHDPSRQGRWGLYVGQTARDPDWRFDQHKTGYKASGAVRRFGVQLLPNLVDHLNPMQGWESLELEAALAAAFRLAGIGWVEGGH